MIRNKKIFRIVITPGEPSGIGPDITIMIAQKKWPVELVVCADSNLLLERAKKINMPLTIKPYQKKNLIQICQPGELSVLNTPLHTKAIPGQLNTDNNSYVINTLIRAAQGCMNKEFEALITGPINKAILNKNGTLFSGHTEFLAKNNGCKNFVMMLMHEKLRIALATTHIPISSISKMITQENLYSKISILNTGLQKYFNILHPKIYVCGLNPHAGESGFIGKEEIDIIIPTLKNLRKNYNYNITGPLSADTMFQKKYLQKADVILTMYHDQGLPVLKYSGFTQSVNITFGLPFIRTSVDHGTALELSGTGLAKSNSIEKAITIAIKMINNVYAKKNIF